MIVTLIRQKEYMSLMLLNMPGYSDDIESLDWTYKDPEIEAVKAATLNATQRSWFV